MRQALAITSVPLPANSGTVILIDSTRRLLESTASAASAQAPGSYRCAWTGARLTGSVTPTGQTITITYEIMHNSAGTTSSAFSTDTNAPGGGTQTVATTVTQPFSWLPATNDFRIRITAGATAPTALAATCELIWDRTSGA